MSSKRKLKFDSLNDVGPEVQRLATVGYSKVGKWDLAQACGHLDNWMTYSMDGYPKANILVRGILAAMRVTMGKRMLRKILANGFSDGGPTMPDSVPAAGASTDQGAADHLCSTLQRLIKHSGKIHPSPLFGSLDRPTMLKMHLLHCEHHLGFLIPKE
jgi:Protein of unknown function (DUF1569)